MNKTFLAFFFYCAAALVRTYPLLCHLSSRIPNDLGDPLLNIWILAWEHHALFTDPTTLFHGNIFYPSPYTITLSEHMLANLPLFAPVYAATGNPVLAYNVVFFFSFVLSSLGVFLLVHYWTRGFWAALVAGFLFGFAPVRFYHLGHLQLLNFFWAPLALLFLDRFLRGQRGSVAGFTCFFCLQFLTSGYLGYLTAIAAGVYIVFFWGLRRDLINRGVITSLGISAAVGLLILLPFHLPYFWARSEWGLWRSLEECVFYSADFPLSYLAPASDIYKSFLGFAVTGLSHTEERLLFPGFVLPLLAGIGIFYPSRSGVHFRAREMKVLFGSLCAVAFLLSLGPFLTVWGRNTPLPLPYLGLYYLLPGFDSMRVPARFAHLVVLAASVLAGLGVMRLTELFSRWLRRPAEGKRSFLAVAVSLIIAGLYTLEFGLQPLSLPEVPTGQDVPPVYRWLAERKHEGPILEVPSGERGWWHDFKYMYFSTYHWRPLVNGHSGFAPPSYFHMVKFIDDLPSSRSVAYLSALGVTTIILHTYLLSAEERERWDNLAPAEVGLKKIQQFGPDIVYRVTASPSPCYVL